MIRFVCLLTTLLVISTACSRESSARLPTQPSVPTPAPVPGPPSPPPGQAIKAISIGEEVKGHFNGTTVVFEVMAPRDGTLSVTLTWDPWFTSSLLVLNLHGTPQRPVPPAWSPVAGMLQVSAGQLYRVAVEAGGTDWFYDDEFRLTTDMR